MCAVEASRGCGYRKVGGLYLVCPPVFRKCDREEIPLVTCEVCGGGIKQARGWTWIEPLKLIGMHMVRVSVTGSVLGNTPSAVSQTMPCPDVAQGCKFCAPPEGKHGLMWIGEKFYTPESFNQECMELGVSKRIKAVPRGFELGKTVVYLAHPKAIKNLKEPKSEGEEPEEEYTPGMFLCFKPSAIEKIVKESELRDELMLKRLEKAGITAVPVPDDDPDHQ